MANEEWVEVQILCHQADQDLVADMLHEAGSRGTVLEDTLDAERLHGAEATGAAVSGYFPADRYLPAMKERLKSHLATLVGRAGVTYEPLMRWKQLESADWVEAWKQHYHVTPIDEHLVVVPEWEAYEPEPGQVVIRIDPGMAFGSGTHDSTRFALRALRNAIQGNSGMERMLDVGTGSGILAIGALKLGVSRAVAIDIDRSACERANHNARLNGVEHRLTTMVGDLADYVEGAAGTPADWYTETGTPRPAKGGGRPESPAALDRPFPLVIANLTPDLILYLAIPLCALTQPRGTLVVSGITRNRESEVLEALWDLEFELVERVTDVESDWVSLRLVRGQGGQPEGI